MSVLHLVGMVSIMRKGRIEEKGHCGLRNAAVSGPFQGPLRVHASPQATQTSGLCTLWLLQVKASGLVQAFALL